MRRLRPTAMCMAVILLCACTSLGLAPAQTFNQKLAYAYGTHTAVLQATTASVTAGSLSSADASYVLKLADDTRTLLDSAATLAAQGDAIGANNKLALATAALTALQTYLNNHKGK
jgi:hypothetical protein